MRRVGAPNRRSNVRRLRQSFAATICWMQDCPVARLSTCARVNGQVQATDWGSMLVWLQVGKDCRPGLEPTDVSCTEALESAAAVQCTHTTAIERSADG